MIFGKTVHFDSFHARGNSPDRPTSKKQMVQSFIFDGFFVLGIFQFQAVVGEGFEVFECCGCQFRSPDQTITLTFEMDRVEGQLCSSQNEDTGDRHCNEKLDHRKSTLVFFLKGEKIIHVYRPSIAKPFARDVPSLIAGDFRENLRIWCSVRQQMFQIREILEKFKSTDVYPYRSAWGSNPTLCKGMDSIA
jgi:hypothetical protein